MPKLLLVEDEATLRLSLADELREAGFVVYEAADAESGVAVLCQEQIDVLVTDLKLPGTMSGLDILERARSLSPRIVAIIITAHGTVENAVAAMKKGADDYLTKPFATDELLIILERNVRLRQLEIENVQLRARLREEYNFENIVGESAAIREIKNILRIVAPSDETILIEGETGTGKELIAQTIHENSRRSRGPFVVVSCASLPEGLLDSELYGHERGAFTGAFQRRIGRIESAAGGTLMLDDVDDIPLSQQVKLLRVLQEGEFSRLGSSQVIKSDVRVIAATKKDLFLLSEQGTFRSDLFYRLNVIPIQLLPLRERTDDIIPLFSHFARRYSSQDRDLPFSAAALRAIQSYSWPGNVRQVENLVKRLVVLSQGTEIGLDLLPQNVINDGSSAKLELTGTLNYFEVMASTERRLLAAALEQAHGNKTLAAEILGIKASTFRDRLARFDIH